MSRLISLEVAETTFKLTRPFRTALRHLEAEVSALRIDLDFEDKASGVGFAAPVPEVTDESLDGARSALEGPISRAIVGTNVTSASVANILEVTVDGHPSARSAVEMAMRDRDRTEVEQLFVRTDATVSAIDTPGACDEAKRLVEAGFSTLKLKADDRPDIARHLIATYSASLARAIRIDPNQSWTPERTLEIAAQLHDRQIPVEFIEQPVHGSDVSALVDICARSPYPIAADESVHTLHDLPRMAAIGMSYIVVKIGKTGSWTGAAEMAEATKRLDMTPIISSMLEPLPCVEEAAHLALQVAPEDTHDLDAAMFFAHGEDAYAPPSFLGSGKQVW